MDLTEVEALVGGYHGDPFRLLGPHAVLGADGEPGWEVRAFLPQARTVELIHDSAALPMVRQHQAGFFSVPLEDRPESYRLRITRYDDSIQVLHDPYRFPQLLTDYEIYLYGEGTNYESYRTFGAHLTHCQGVAGVRFAVWAPNAISVCVAGDFNEYDLRRHPMRAREGGIWELFLPDIETGATYKYNVRSRFFGHQQLKSDPYGFASEVPPRSASIVCDLGEYEWRDAEWLAARAQQDPLRSPMATYEVHLQSWLKGPQNTILTYRELAATLVPYVKRLGYTHIELLPIQEHPYGGSWGYQVVGYYAPTSRFGTPADFMYFVDRCHQEGIGVIVDWVPAHFPKDAHGLAFFDGTALYEHADPRKGEHKDWGTLIFNFGRNEVRTFLISNAMFWLKQYHIDGLRVDAVASMLYLDYSRKAGEWVPNIHGGNENLEAIEFLHRFNEQAHTVPGAMTIAEESTAFPGVSRPVYAGGLGFTMKWNMGWMHDMLHYIEQEPVHRKYSHNSITFSLLYAFTENFVLPISHDEVVYGKRSLLSKMPGDEWQRFANNRAFLAYMYAHPGKKLLFMGSEIGQYEEWNYDTGLRWDVLQYPFHEGLQATVIALNQLYRSEPALYEVDFHYSGFEWIDFRDVEHSVIAFLRRATNPQHFIVVCCNFTPVPREQYRLGVPKAGYYRELLNTDAAVFGGSNMGNGGGVMSEPMASHGHKHSVLLTLPPLSVLLLKAG